MVDDSERMAEQTFAYRYTGDLPAYMGGEVARDLAPGDEFESDVALNNPALEPANDAARRARAAYENPPEAASETAGGDA